MPRIIRYTLVSDGQSDQMLLHPIDWLLRCHLGNLGVEFEGRWADLRTLQRPPRGLSSRCVKAIALYRCELLFVHRDAETGTREERVREIRQALVNANQIQIPSICVIPVRMTEAWFLFHEAAIRQASGNPNGSVSLRIPPLDRVEDEPDPKLALHSALRDASELNGRRLKKFQIEAKIHRVAELITNYAPLRRLSTFNALEHEIRIAIDGLLGARET